MTDDKALSIFQVVLKRTLAGELAWRKIDKAGMRDVFSCETPGGFTLRVYPHTDYDSDEGEGPPSLTLFDNANQLIFDITTELEGVSGADLSSLYVAARRKALGVDDKLVLLLEDIHRMPPESQ